jgi:hypothetical protein
MNAHKKGDWRGPPTLEFPKEEARRGNVVDMPLYGAHSPSGPGLGDSATRTHVWPRQPGGGSIQRDNYDDIAFGPKAAALEAERRKLESEKLDAEREKHKAELAQRDAAHKAEMSSLESKLMNEIRAARAPTGPDPMLKLMEMQAEDRRQAEERRREDTKIAAEQRREDARLERERQERADTRAAEDRRLERERQDKIDQRLAEERRDGQARFEKLFEKVSERKERDPLEMIEKASSIFAKKQDSSEALAKTVHNMVEMQSSTMGMAMDFVDQAMRVRMDQQGGGEEPSWVKGIDRLMKGIGKMALARAGAPQLPQVPAGQPQQAPQQPGQPQQQPQQASPPVIDQILNAIRQYHPPAQVAAALIHYYQDPSVQQALAEAGGDFEVAFKNKLGNWVNENHNKNQPYMDALRDNLDKLLKKAGYYADEPDESADEPDEPGDEEEDAEIQEGDEGGEE